MSKLALLFLGVVACSTPSSAPDATSDPVPLTGQTGALTVTTANTIVNEYGVLGASVAAGATTLTVTSAADFTATAPFTTALAAGDLLMIYQPQGATIDATNTAAYGNVTVLGTAGRYELVHVASVAGTTITLEATCGGLKSAYTTAGATEVIRVPQLTTLTISGAGSITARAWDGARGGVVAIQAQTTATLGGGGIDVTGKGFRGGAADDVTTGPPGTTTIRSASNATGGEKGESIAGFQASYDAAFNGRYGRGAPANGGGGGDAHNGGGGGGANGNNGSAWTGAGVMDGTVTGAAAWSVDPDFVLNGNARTTSSGGGRGGYTFSGADQNALTVAPGDASWAGDSRRDVGGLGGRPLANDPTTRLFLGGGGGAGDGNNTAAGPGGPGGGLVLLIAPTVTGTAAITANGAVGVDAMHNPGDAPGGGGAGGTIVVAATALSGIAIHANGGVGGNQTLQANLEAEGPGGGGGGGFVAVSGGAITATATGALGGITNAPTLAEFPSNGGTSGATGVANGAVTTINACTTDDLQLTNTDGKATVVAGTVNTYTLVVTNAGADVVAGATVTEAFPAALTGVTWTCVASAGGSCPASGSGNLGTPVTVAPGGTVTFTITGTVDPSATGTLAVTAVVTAPPGVTDPTPGNNTASDTDQISVSADLSIAITDAPDPVAPGGTETYTVTVTDLGPSTATGITVTETLPAGATFVSATGSGWTCTQAGGIVTCTRPSLPPGAAPPITIVVTAPNTPGTITDTATVSSTSTDPTPGNNSASQMTTVGASADLAIAITDAPDPVALAGTETYTITVTDLGPGAAANLTVTDTLPAGATFVSAMGTGWTCVQAGVTVTCTRPALAVGAAPPIAIVVTAPNVAGTITDAATVTATSTDPVPGNNSASQMTTVGPSADLSIAITDAPDPVALGGTETYTVTVTNLGPNAATSLTVTDTLPAGATFVSATGTGWTCVQAGGTVTCTRPALAVGAAPAIAIIVTAPNTAGSIVDAATVTATSTDPTPANNSAMQTTTVGTGSGTADLAIALTDAPDPVAAGGTLTYTATVTNLGPNPATGVTVVDTLPAGATFVSATGTGWTCTVAGSAVTCTAAMLALGAAPAISIVVTAPAVVGTITDTATVTTTSVDPVPGNDAATQMTTVGPVADLAIAITDAPDPVALGGTLTYTVAVTNLGPSGATNLTVVDTLPPGATFVSAMGTGWACAQAGGTVTCTRPALAAGAAPPISIVVTAPNAAGSIIDAATVAATSNDPTAGNNSATQTTTVGAAGTADLAIALTDAPDPVAAGGMLTYTATVTNLGPNPASGVTVTDTLPAGATFVSATGTGWTCTVAGTTVTCTAPTLALGAAPAITIVVTAPVMVGTITDTATVAATSTDPVAGNNTATQMTTVGPSADLAIAITDAPDPVALGGMLTYTVAVTNLGPSAATNLTVTDTIPATATFVSATGTGWTCVQAGVTVTCTRPALAVGAAPPIAIVVTAPNLAGAIVDAATVTATSPDPVAGNNSAMQTTTVGAAGSADLAIALTDAPDPVAAGGTLTYTATVTNLGPNPATSVTVVDALPSGTTFVSAMGTGWACALAGTTVTCTTPLLAVGGAPAITIVVTAPSVIGTITDTVTVAATSTDPVPGNNTATAMTMVGPAADLAISIVGAPDPVPAGGTETFTVTVTNSGPSTATGVTVTETLPPGATFVSATGTGWSCTQAAGVVTCTTPSIPPGGAPPITIVVTMPTTPGVVTTTVGVTATTSDPVLANNTASTATTIGATGSADLAIAITVLPDPVAPSGTLAYTLAITNLGPDTAANVVVKDTLPVGATFITATGTGWTCTAAGQVVTCTTPTLTAGAAPAIAITATAPATSGGITDTGTVAATTPDPVATNNTASVTSQVGVGPTADLAIAITDDGPVVAHHTLTFTVTVANLGPDAPADLVVRTMLPSDATVVTASNDWTCTTTSQVVTCRAATMTTAPIEIQVTAPGTGTTSATATVSNATADPVTSNNTATDTVDVTPNLTVRGGGCDASGGGSTGALVLLAVAGLVLRRRRLALVTAGALALPAVAAAQSADSFPVERMRVAIDRDGILGVEWAGAPARWAWNLGTWIGYADDPLVLDDRDTGDRVSSLVHRRLGGGLFGAVGLTSWLEVGLEMPLIYAQDASGSTMGALASPKLGDLRFAPKLVLRQGADRLGVALMVGFTLPSSGSSAYAGDRGATFDPELILSRAWGGFRLAGNLGYLARKTEMLMDLTVDDELYARIGAGYRVASRPLELDVTTGISTAAAKPFAQINTDPWEVDLAAQYDVRRDVTLFALGGMGIGAGFGSPDYRVVLGLRFTRMPPVAPRDTDGDGIIDELDKCPTEPEDKDGFEDADGCPDPDNDKDGIPDVADKCPNEPEDKDGFEDADGCPDPDNDKDGIPDVADKCPNEPEDKDGFEDTDGCPDPDNDKDGILDADDKCPNEPGPAVTFGCPDPDRDGDGVPDRIDNCPDEPGPVENHGCAKKQLVTITNGKLELVDRVYFRTDKDIIETRSNAILDNVAKVLLAHPEIAKVRVEGHTDNRGGAKHNQDLSQRRAAAVVKYLVGKKVERDRLDPAGFGQDRPIADNDSDTGRATNRRVEFVIVGDGVETKATGPDAGTIGK